MAMLDRLFIIYLTIGLVLTIVGVQNTSSTDNPFNALIDSSVTNGNAPSKGQTGLNASFQADFQPRQTIATGVFGFIDTLFSVFKFITYIISSVVLSPITFFLSYQIPYWLSILLGSIFMIGFMIRIIYLVRSGS